MWPSNLEYSGVEIHLKGCLKFKSIVILWLLYVIIDISFSPSPVPSIYLFPDSNWKCCTDVSTRVSTSFSLGLSLRQLICSRWAASGVHFSSSISHFCSLGSPVPLRHVAFQLFIVIHSFFSFLSKCNCSLHVKFRRLHPRRRSLPDQQSG